MSWIFRHGWVEPVRAYSVTTYPSRFCPDEESTRCPTAVAAWPFAIVTLKLASPTKPAVRRVACAAATGESTDAPVPARAAATVMAVKRIATAAERRIEEVMPTRRRAGGMCCTDLR